MANLEFDYTDKDYQLIATQEEQTLGEQDYVRLIVNNEAGVIATANDETDTPRRAIFYSTLSQTPFYINSSPFENKLDILSTKKIGIDYNGDNLNDFKIYKNPNDQSIYLKPNDVLEEYGLSAGNYELKIDFLKQVRPTIRPFEDFYIPDDFDGLLESPGDDAAYRELPFPKYLEEFDITQQGFLDVNTMNAWIVDGVGRFDIAEYILIILEGAAANPSTPFPDATLPEPSHYQFLIKQISTSRKEIRLKLINENITQSSEIFEELSTQLGSEDEYQHQHRINVGTSDNIPIVNYAIDAVTDGTDNQSIIIKLYEKLPTTISNLKQITLEKEVLITQTVDIYYFSSVVDEEQIGVGLEPDESQNWINNSENESLQWENYNDLTSSVSNASIHNILSSSTYDYPNLNVDYNDFSNHTFFGSAKRKLVNFKNKVKNIQNYYGDISASLSASGVAFDGDSDEIKLNRENLFNKVDSEINSFTPYERFLYFDGQSESTASAPTLGTNFAHTIPVVVNKSHEGILEGEDGFDTVYHQSSRRLGKNKYTGFFTTEYYAHKKPFFNYSSSLYMSFLMKGTDGLKFSYGNRQYGQATDVAHSGLQSQLPENSLGIYKTSSPQITGSHWHRYIFVASASYWAPTNALKDDGTRVNYDIANIDKWSRFSDQIEILSGSVKTGSAGKIKDSSGKLSNLCTVVTQSGVPFIGSVMPGGEIFRLFNSQHTITSSLSGSWKIDDITSGSALSISDVTNDAGPSTGDATSINNVTASDGLIHPATGRQYGSSYYIVSESSPYTTVQLDTTDFNFSKDTPAFSLSIWAKRFHSLTGSADTSDHSKQRQEIFVRGSTSDSYGIDYASDANAYRVGVRSGSTSYRVQKTMDDDGLNWHHLVMTYESGSATGIKLYIDGVLESEGTNIGVGEFSASSPTTGESLSFGGQSTLSGNGDSFNGYLQYPRVYGGRALTQDEVIQLYNTPNGIIEGKVTDVKVTLEDPTDVLPFDNLYHTSSTTWTSWYDGLYDSASAWDKENIHSLENNLPLYIQESSDYNELKDFLALQGEQYDMIKNHIDGLGTLHDRGYKKEDSAPENTYPILLNNMGYEAINPFSGSLGDSLGSYLNSATSIDDIRNNTYRKTLNNLLHVYKTKGTQNSVRSLLNIYGYPPDLFELQEFGGTTRNPIQSSPGFIKDTPPVSSNLFDIDLNKQTGSVSFTNKKSKLYNYKFQNNYDKTLNIDWWMDNAEPNTIEFVYKHNTTTGTQEILKSSGSGDESLWDLRLVPSTDGISSSFEFRLNNSNTGSSAIASNAVSMSTGYNVMTDGQLWNVMLQRATSSVSGSGTNEYRLHAALQDGASIRTYSYATMSVSGGITNTYVTGGADSNYYANQNWSMSGSRHYLSSSNLTVGDTSLSGSLAEIKSWTTCLSHSRFRQHTLNKFSTVGNSIDSYRKELIYHFKLNENYSTSSISSSTQTEYIIDSAPKEILTTNYSFSIPLNIITSSALYGFDYIDKIMLGLQDNNESTPVDKSVNINPKFKIAGDLSSKRKTTYDNERPEIKTSTKLEINRSPQDFVNDHILNNMDSFNFEKYYGNPKYQSSQSYDEFDTLRKNFFNDNPIYVNTNKFIRAHENMFNDSIANGLKALVPARSTLSDKNQTVGVTIKPTLLEKQKYEHEIYSVETNPNSPSGSSISLVETGSYQNGFILSSILELPKSASISMGNAYASESVGGRYITPNFLQPNGYTASIESSKDGLISIVKEQKYIESGSITYIQKSVGFGIESSSLEVPQSASISMGNAYASESIGGRYTTPNFIQPNGYTASIEFPKSGSIEEITTQYTKEFVNIHDSWGTATTDTHFMNYGAGKSEITNTSEVSHLDLRFKQSASFGSTITLTSATIVGNHVYTGSTAGPNLDEVTFKTVTYTAVTSSGDANLDFNGAFNADSSSVLFLTGSGTTIGQASRSQAENLIAAITSSNGHGDSFTKNTSILAITQFKNRVPLIFKIRGTFGNTFSASYSSDMADALESTVAGNILPFTGGEFGIGSFNIGHIDTRYNFRLIGDVEHYSSSYGHSSDFTNFSYFYNREQITENLQAEVEYDSYLPTTVALGGKAPPSETTIASLQLKGKMMGKTRYFWTGSTGDIILPSNHINKFSNPFKDVMENGSQNTNPGILNTRHEDYATASFYRVKVTGGERQIWVGGESSPSLDSDDKIMR